MTGGTAPDEYLTLRMENKMQDSKRSPESFTLEEVISSTRDLEKMMKNYGWNDCPMCGYNPKRLADFLDFIEQELSKAREEGRRETLLEMQMEFSEYGVPDDVRYTHSLFYINNIIEEKLSKLKDNK